MMLNRRRSISSTITFALCVIASLSTLTLAAKQFFKPVPKPAKSYPLHDEHADEVVTVAVDPYITPDKASIFSVRYADAGMLPLYIVITNDGDQPVALGNMDAKFVTSDRVKIPPSGTDEIYRRLSRPRATTASPLPWPTKKVKGGVSKQAQEEIQNAQFLARAVEPHSTQAGFMFFDISDLSTPLAGAHFYLTGLRNSSGGELIYFEVPLDDHPLGTNP